MDLKTLRAWLTETDHKLFSMSSDFLKSDDELKECLDEHRVCIGFEVLTEDINQERNLTFSIGEKMCEKVFTTSYICTYVCVWVGG